MNEFLKFVVGQLVDLPESLVIHEEGKGNEIHFTLTLPRSEVGKVIGKQGHTIQAVRTLLSVAASRTGHRASLEITEEAAA